MIIDHTKNEIYYRKGTGVVQFEDSNESKCFATTGDLNNYLHKNQTGSFVTISSLTGYVQQNDLTGFATQNDITGLLYITDITGYVTQDQITGFLSTNQTGDFFPIALTGNFVASDITGNFVTISETGSFVTKEQTGVFIDTSKTGIFLSVDQTGQFVPVQETGNFVHTYQTGDFVSIYQTGDFLNINQTGEFVSINETGNFVYSGQTGNFVSKSETGSLIDNNRFNQFFHTGYMETGNTGISNLYVDVQNFKYKNLLNQNVVKTGVINSTINLNKNYSTIYIGTGGSNGRSLLLQLPLSTTLNSNYIGLTYCAINKSTSNSHMCFKDDGTDIIFAPQNGTATVIFDGVCWVGWN